jgi:hypothetical protein
MAVRALDAKALWELVDTQGRLNHTHECIGRHPVDATPLRIRHSGGRRETHTFGTLAPQELLRTEEPEDASAESQQPEAWRTGCINRALARTT